VRSVLPGTIANLEVRRLLTLSSHCQSRGTSPLSGIIAPGWCAAGSCIRCGPNCLLLRCSPVCCPVQRALGLCVGPPHRKLCHDGRDESMLRQTHMGSQKARVPNNYVVHTCKRHLRASTTQPCLSSGSPTGPMRPVTVLYPEVHKPIKLTSLDPTPTPRLTLGRALRSERRTQHLSKAPIHPSICAVNLTSNSLAVWPVRNFHMTLDT
jgi:hypothetical protein